MKRFHLPFEEIGVRLRQPDSKANILAHSPAGKVPALLVGDLLVWDSLAIIEFLADRHPDKGIWPRDPQARAIARAASAEMHSGFQALREHCPMDILSRTPKDELPDAAVLNIRRVVELWRDCRSRFGGQGPFPLLRVLSGGCHVRACRLAIPHLHPRSRALRRRRHRGGLRRGNLRHA